MNDVVLACRGLLRRPGFAASAIATLAVGIGASTAIFAVAYGISLRPLPYPDAARLVRIYEANPGENQLEHDVSVGAFDRWRAGAKAVESMALFSKPRARSVASPEAPRVITMSVSPAFFDVLGIRPMLGAGFRPERAYTASTARDVVLSHGAWRRLFNGRPDVIGATLRLAGAGDDDQFTIVGVMPREFSFLESVDVWTPAIVDPRVASRPRSWRYDRVVARLAPDATIDEAQAQLEAIAGQLEREAAAASAGWTVRVQSLHDSIVGAFGRAAWLMFAAVAVVLLVSCLNVAGLLVARAVARERETAVRVSLGASRARLLRLWLSESAVIAVAGAVLGVLLAHAAVAALIALAPGAIPRLDALTVDRNALALAMAATLTATAFFTLAPLIRTVRGELAYPLRARTAIAGGRGGQLLRTALTAAQCAGAAALVVLAMMFTRSFVNLVSQDLGWRADDIISVQASPRVPSDMRRPWFARAEWALRLVTTLEATQGIGGAAVTTQLPFGPAPFQSALARGRGRTEADDARWSVTEHRITPGYFDLMEIALLTGRAFTPQDRFTEAEMNDPSKRPSRGVAIVSANTARTLWPGQSAIGRAIWLPDSDNVTWREVIGVVGDLQFDAIGDTQDLHVFVPWLQNSASARVYVFVKGGGERTVLALARELVSGTAPGAVVDDTTSLDSLAARATAQPRFTSRVVLLFAALALVLSAVGVYGTLSCIVSSRVNEIGIRLALGARRRDIFGSVLMRGMLPAVGGTAAGVVLGLAIANTFRALLFDIRAVDPISVGTAAALLAFVACATAAGPAYRASRLDPVDTLRVE